MTKWQDHYNKKWLQAKDPSPQVKGELYAKNHAGNPNHLREIVDNHWFYYLIGILRVGGYNEFWVPRPPEDQLLLQTGNTTSKNRPYDKFDDHYLINMDLDRTSFSKELKVEKLTRFEIDFLERIED